jgi:hypothetical protein
MHAGSHEFPTDILIFVPTWMPGTIKSNLVTMVLNANGFQMVSIFGVTMVLLN